MFSTNKSHNYKPVSIAEGYRDGDDYDDSDQEEEEEDFVQRQIRHQQMELKKQDDGLDMLSESAVRLGTLSLGISEELGFQNKMLDEMEDDLDNATMNLNKITKKTRELIQKSGGKRNFMIILGMSCVVVLLLFLIIYS
mmetsp:Transcript_24074/g.27862  ORF Transcript_24074/g.27862 Transcript_24074/m.27862 type:complete len:139 (+) Transcript_24074:267-683(+)